LLFYFTSYVLNMFRTLIYPSSGACDCVVELPHQSSCSQFFVCWRFGATGVEWCSFCTLKHNIAPLICVTFTDSRWVTMGVQYRCKCTNHRWQTWEYGVTIVTRSLIFVYAENRKHFWETRVVRNNRVSFSGDDFVLKLPSLWQILASNAQKFVHVFSYRLEHKLERVDTLLKIAIIKTHDNSCSGFRVSCVMTDEQGGFNPLNAELNPICHLLVLLGAHHVLHISRI